MMKKPKTCICLIDDNPGDVRFIQETMQGERTANYDVLVFSCLADGIAQYEQQRFDILLLDLNLPDSRGLDTLISAREALPQVPVIVLTGLEDEALALQAVQSGAQDYLVKGEFDAKFLARAISYAHERHQLKQRLLEISITDDLTGLNNRRGFTTLSEQQIRVARRAQTDLLFFFIDVDGLKKINDLHGHSMGDRALLATAQILRKTFRQADIIGRLAGDEFAVLAIHSHENHKDLLLDRLEQERQAYHVDCREPFQLSFSIGIAEWSVLLPRSLEVLMGEADAAMYAHKGEKKLRSNLGIDGSLLDLAVQVESASGATPADAEPSSKLILLVEDNPADARLLQVYLEEIADNDYQLHHAVRLADARELLQQHHYAIILLDLSLPDSRGLETIEIMISAAGNVPIVVMTGLDDQQLATSALQLGAQDYLLKGGYDEISLSRSLTFAMERNSLRTQNLKYARQLRQSEARFRRIITESGDGILILDQQKTVLFANPSAEKIFGTNGSSLQGTLLDVSLEEGDIIELAHNGGAQPPFFVDARYVDIPWQGQPAILATVRDITESVLAQKAIQLQAEDLGLINDINHALNQGATIENLLGVLNEGTKRIFQGYSATIYLLSEDRQYLCPQHFALPGKIAERISRFLGIDIPEVRIPIREGSLVEKMLYGKKISVLDGEDDLLTYLKEYLNTPTLPESARALIGKRLPKILKLLDLKVAVFAPMISDGEVIGALDIGAAQPFSAEEIERVAMIARQITSAIARVLADDRLKELSQRHHLILNSAGEGIIGVNLENTITFANASAAQLLGYAPEELVGQNLHTIVHPALAAGDTFPVSAPICISTLNGRPVSDEQDVFWRSDGSSFLVAYASNPIIFNQQILGAVLTFSDITEKLHSEEQLRLQAAALNSAANAVLIADAQGEVIWANPAFSDLTGYDVAEVLGQNPRVLKSGEHDESFYQQMWSTITGGNVWAGEIINQNKSGNHYHEEMTITPLTDERGEITHFIAIKQDITARKRTESTLQQQLNELSVMHKIAIAGMEANSEENLIAQFVNILGEKVYSDHFTVLLMEPDQQRLRVYATYCEGVLTQDDEIFVSIGNGVVGTVAQNGKPGRIDDVRECENYIELNPDIRSELCVPMLVGERVFGVLNAESEKESAFTAADERFLMTTASQLAIVLQNLRLNAETQKRAFEMERLYRASGSLFTTAPNDLESISLTIVETLRSEFGQSNCSLLLIEPKTRALKRLAAVGPYAKEVSSGKALYLDGPGLAPTAAREQRIINIGDVTQQPNYVPNWAAARSEMAIPLIVNGEVIGIIDIQSAEINAFQKDDERLVSVFAERAALALENTRLYDGQQQQLAFLNALHQIDLAITGSMDLQVVLGVVLRHVKTELAADAANIILLDSATASFKLVAHEGYRERNSHLQNIRYTNSLGADIVMQGKSMHSKDIQQACVNPERKAIFEREGLHGYYGTPLIAKGEIKGVLELLFKQQDFELDHQWQYFADTIATQAAIAVDNANLFEKLEHSNMELSLAYDTTLEGWAKALELRDQETEGHSRRVTELAVKLGRAMNVQGADMIQLRRGAILHDIGKMGVPDHILQKPGPLTDEEWEIMRLHPVYAYEWLRSIRYLQPALDIPHYHHERWDGSGYPEGLRGEQIPKAARLFAIVDVWDALRSDRPYRKAWTHQKAIEHLKKQSGSHFDPAVVVSFLAIIDSQPEI
ncbi:MAG: GAF domain-containing protein [Chloroflexi bacterium]|jgi:diguanylate cyclase (GGDEF)-like protein/PAS domain S-box-containing protein|nr:GAF domain-containing protein [Chloroflexota bacterium]